MTVTGGGQATSRAQLRKYRDVIALWLAKFDTQSIADRLDLPEHLVARWVGNFRDLMRDAA